MSKKIVGFIGGSGIYSLESIENLQEHEVQTPFGEPSDQLMSGTLNNCSVVFLSRHGRGHKLLPSEINYRANIYALKKLGVTHIVSISAVGSLRDHLAPGSVVIPSQIFDYTKSNRAHTFFGDGLVGHVSFAYPYCEKLRLLLKNICTSLKVNFQENGTSVCIEGPRFSTKAESHFFRQINADIIGMTSMPEAVLAREAEIPYANVSFVTDFDCWKEEQEGVSVEMVVETIQKNAHLAKEIVKQVVQNLPEDNDNPIFTAAKDVVMTTGVEIPFATKEKLKLFYQKYW